MIIFVVFTTLTLIILRKEYYYKKEVGWKFNDHDLHITFKGISSLIFFSFIGSLVSAFLGVGPAVVLAPIMLKEGLTPNRSAATCVYIAMYSTLASTIVVMIYGNMVYDYAISLIVVSIIGGLVGTYL